MKVVLLGEKVSIVITCYNYGRFLGKAIESALVQTYQNIEVIVVDDGSQDETSAVAAKYSDRIIFIRQENSGVSAARNRGYRECHGTFVNFLDADDWLEPDKIALQMRRFVTDPDLDLVASGRYDVDESGQILATVIPEWGPNVLDHLLNNTSFIPSSALIRLNALERVGGFCEEKISASWTEDTDLWFRLAGTGSRFFVERAVLCAWRHHTTTLSRSEELKASFVGFNKMTDRLEAMNFPTVTEKQWQHFRALYRIAFCGRAYARGDLDFARDIFRELSEQFGDELQKPAIFYDLCLRTSLPLQPVHLPLDIKGVRELFDYLVGKLLVDLASDLTAKKKVQAVATLAVADQAYALGCTQLARFYSVKALKYSMAILSRRDCVAVLARAAFGPKLGGWLGSLVRQFRRSIKGRC